MPRSRYSLGEVPTASRKARLNWAAKTAYDLTAPKAGRLKLLVQPEIPFQRGDVIASIE
jgi:hypothetical protein